MDDTLFYCPQCGGRFTAGELRGHVRMGYDVKKHEDVPFCNCPKCGERLELEDRNG